jgi:hypothetical protein
MFGFKKKNNTDPSPEQIELTELREENARYRSAFEEIKDVSKRVSQGDLTARIIRWDDEE